MTARVLLVGDNGSMMESVRNRISSGGFDVEAVGCPREALSFAEQADIDVVIVNFKDLMADGILFLKNLKKSRPLTEVITLSVPSAVRFSIESMKQGAFADLPMPFEPDVLVEKIREAWKKREKAKKGLRTFRQRFEDFATSAAFAEAGDFDTARQMAKKRRNTKGSLKKEEE